MDLDLKDRVVLVTGGSGDIGRAIVTAFADEGARVVVGWHSNERGAADLVAAVPGATAARLDQGDPAAVARIAAEHAVEVLVANAVAWPSWTETWESLTRGLVTNVAGTVMLADAVLPGMRERGWGRIVMVSSDIVDQPMAAGVGYPAAKGAVEAAARVLAVREAEHGILTNVVRPGFTLTDRALSSPGLGQAAVDAEGAKTPTGRICTPRDVASTVVFLGSGGNGHVNGETVSVSGGRHLKR